jgi:hypothetical protein
LVQNATVLFNRYLRKQPQRLIIPQTLLRKVLNPAPEGTPTTPEVAPALTPEPTR